MSPLGALLVAKLRRIGHTVASVRGESRLKVALVSVSTVLLWGGGFYLARRAFRWLDGIGGELLGLSGGVPGATGLDDLIMARLLSLFALALFFLLIMSNLLVVFTTLYRSREVAYLVHSPLDWRSLFLGRFAECVLLSSWASAFLGSPILLAYGLQAHAPPAFYLALVAVYLPFVTIPAALGALAVITLVRWLPRLSAWRLAGLAVLVLGGLFLLFRQRVQVPDFSRALSLPALLDLMGASPSAWLPSQWASRAVMAAATGDLGEAFFHFLLLAANALFLTWLATELAARWFHPGWSDLQGLDRDRTRLPGRGLLGRLEGWLRPLPEPARSLVLKDLRLFWRDPAQWTQFVLFFGILALYLANMRATSPAYDPQLWQSWLTLLNLTASMLILATLTTRFMFPLISLEGRRFWLLGLAPLTLRQVLAQKFWLSVVTTSAFTVGLVLLSGLRLELSSAQLAISVFGISAANLALSGLAVGLGGLYPNFEEDNPSRIVSGLGGTLNFIFSMAFIVLVGAAQTALLQWPFLSQLTGFEIGYGWVLTAGLGFIAALSAATCLIPLRLGLRHLQATDF